MTYTFAKAHNGEIGDSIVELDKLDVALGVEELAKKNGVELVLGSDCTATNGLDFGTMTVKEGAEIINCPANKVPAGFEGVDAGPDSQEDFRKAIEGAKTILWNGPAGVFECDKFTAGSRAIGEAIAKLVLTSSVWLTRYLTSLLVVVLCSRLSRVRFSQV